MRLSRHITEPELRKHLASLPRKKAPGPDGLPYELIRSPSAKFCHILLHGVNSALTNIRQWPEVWKSGDIRFLYKKGSPVDISNYRPVVLLSAIYKIITAVVCSRLSAIAEKYGLLADQQEGFRPCRNTNRQIQALLWDRADAQRRRQMLIVAYIDFANAFNSVDHEALWAWLTAIGIPDVDLLRHIYSDSFFQADTPYGKSAAIFLNRGT